MATVFESLGNFLFQRTPFMPHGVCLDWRPDLIALHAISDMGILLAYATIPAALFYFANARKDLAYRPVFNLFALFILACGVTHAFGILTLWEPVYGLQGVFKLMTAAISIVTAVVIWPILPKALALPSPNQLREVNDDLLHEMSQRRQIEERFRDFANVSADWFWEQDKNLRFTYVSKASGRGDYWQPSQFIGKTRRETLGNEVSEAQLQAHERLLEQRKPFHDFRASRVMENGRTMYISLRGTPYYDADGEFAGYRGTGTDITELVKTERALRSERDRAESATIAKSNFVANMSHELRTPLNGIIGYSEFLTLDIGQAIAPDKRQEILQDIRKASTHLLALIDDVLDLSRIESGKIDIRPAKVSVKSALQDCIEILGARAVQKKVALDLCDLDPRLAVWADPKHVSQILVNILGNAVKYNRREGAVDITAHPEGIDCVAITVRDNGVGIAREDLPKIFEKFERAGNVLSHSEGGTGLGLPLAKQLVELNGGSITVDSAADIGTTVTIILPKAVG